MLLPRIRLFLTSPGDVSEERAIVRTFVRQLALDPFVRDRATIELVAWDTPGGGTPMVATRTPQASIDAGLPRPSECDIVVAVFWNRIGTPLPHPEYARPDNTAFESGSVWELEEAMARARREGEPRVLIYRRTPPLPIELTSPDADERISQFRRLEAYFRGFSDAATGVITTAHATYEQPDEFRTRVEVDVRTFVRDALEGAVRGRLHEVDAVPSAPWRGSPFPGLRSFTPDDAPIFFGRGRETDLLVRRVADTPVVTVVGGSGSGKSSLVGAGLLPRLAAVEEATRLRLPGFDRATGQWSGLRITPGALGPDPLIPLAAQLAPMVARPARDLADGLRRSPGTIGRLADEVAPGGALVFVDQFEEVFTMVDEPARLRFVELLGVLAASGRHRVVATLRSDFYHRCLELPELARLMEGGQVPLATPSDTLPEMITGPAAVAGLTLEEGLVGRLLADTGRGPGALPLLAFALDELHRVSEGTTLTIASYEAIGGVPGAIGVRAEHVFRTQLDVDEHAAFDSVFRELVEVDDDARPARRRAPLRSIDSDATASRLVRAFTDARLLVTAAGVEGPTVEVAHEALFRSWGRLRALVDRQQEDLRLLRVVERAARDWDRHGRPATYLWPHERLAPVYEMRRRLPVTLDAATEAFIAPEAHRLLAELVEPGTAPYQRAAIADRLATIGESTVPHLVPLLGSADPAVRAAAVQALTRIGGPALGAVVADGCTAPVVEGRLGAVAVLRAVGGAEAVPGLVQLVADADERVRSAAVGALGAVADAAGAAAEGIAQALRDRSVDVRWRAVGALGAFGAGAVPLLLDALLEDDDEVHATAARAIVALGATAVPYLVSQLGAEAAADRRHAAGAVLERIGAEAAVGLSQSAPSPDPDEEWRIVSLLGAIGSDLGTRRAAAGLRSPDAVIRLAAVDALRSIGDPASIPDLLPMLADDDAEVVDLAADALGRFGPGSAQSLVSLLDTTLSDHVVRAARTALLAAGAPAVTELLDSLPGAARRERLELALVALGGVAAPGLVDRLAPDRALPDAGRILVDIGPAAVPSLLAAVESRDDPRYPGALAALAALGAEDAAPFFAVALDDHDAGVRAAAVTGLALAGEAAVPFLRSRLGTIEEPLRASVVAAASAVGGPAVPMLLELAYDGRRAEATAARAVLDEVMTPAAVFDTYRRRWDDQQASGV